MTQTETQTTIGNSPDTSRWREMGSTLSLPRLGCRNCVGRCRFGQADAFVITSRYELMMVGFTPPGLPIQTLFATALTMADGILTPAVSVTSSVGGLAVVAPIVTDHVIPISIGFLIALFCGQRFGTAKLSVIFAPREYIRFVPQGEQGLLLRMSIAPVTFLWFALIGISGWVPLTFSGYVLQLTNPFNSVSSTLRLSPVFSARLIRLAP